jgi:PelA/Pel-15E family pectate lyase
MVLAFVLSGVAAVAAADRADRYLAQPDSWFRSVEGRQVVANVLSFQSSLGSWPKNIDDTSAAFTGDPSTLKGTFDNSATTSELRLLARAHRVAPDARIQAAFIKGLDHILAAQYPNGGWPQRFPPGDGYARYITFNDDTMVRLMSFLREVSTTDDKELVDDRRRALAHQAFDRGVDCILHCQILVGAKRTVWCAQHDENDFRPRPARTYELASLSGSESVGITRLLMSLDKPGPNIVRAVEGAIAWFERAKLTGLRVDYRDDPQAPHGKDKIVVEDPAAGPLWARFYDIDTNQPIFVDRDGVPKKRLSEIGYERRNGYGWLGTSPQSLLEVDYPKWRKRWANDN